MLNLHWEAKCEGLVSGLSGRNISLVFALKERNKVYWGFFPLFLSLSLVFFISTTKACNNLDVSKKHQDLLSCIARYTLEIGGRSLCSICIGRQSPSLSFWCGREEPSLLGLFGLGLLGLAFGLFMSPVIWARVI